MTQVLSYRANPLITKTAFVTEMEAHAEADRIVCGIFWENSRGCAVGCGVQSIINLTSSNYKHSDYATLADALGIPIWLANIEETIFERLPEARYKRWPVEFARAIPDGADLSRVWREFAPWMLRTIALPGAGTNSEVAQVIERVAMGIESDWSQDSASAASYAAYAATSATSAAYAASIEQMADKLLAILAATPVVAA